MISLGTNLVNAVPFHHFKLCAQGCLLGIGWTGGVLFTGKDNCSSIQHSLTACIFCVGLRLEGFSPSTLACLMVYFLCRSCCTVRMVPFYWCRFWHFQNANCHSKLRNLLSFIIFLLPFLKCPLRIRYRSCFVDVFMRTELQNSAFWLIIFIYSLLHLFQQGVYLMRCKDYTFLWSYK